MSAVAGVRHELRYHDDRVRPGGVRDRHALTSGGSGGRRPHESAVPIDVQIEVVAGGTPPDRDVDAPRVSGPVRRGHGDRERIVIAEGVATGTAGGRGWRSRRPRSSARSRRLTTCLARRSRTRTRPPMRAPTSPGRPRSGRRSRATACRGSFALLGLRGGSENCDASMRACSQTPSAATGRASPFPLATAAFLPGARARKPGHICRGLEAVRAGFVQSPRRRG